jgi:hypothetical protein
MNATATSVLRTKPWQHQRDAVAFVTDLYARGKRGAMIAAAMGTGKSAMTVYLCAEQGFELILIVCPLRVVQVWKPQFAAHTTTPFQVIPLDDSFAGVRAKQAEAERQIKLAKARGVPAVVVINYDSIWRPPFADWAMKQKWDLVVADEIHKSRAPGGKASRFMAALGRAAKHRLGLSGTPMPHSPLDVYGYFRFLDATIFGWSFNKFRQHYAVMGGFQNHQVVAYRNLDELIHHHVGHLAPTFFEAVRQENIKGIGVGQTPGGRPPSGLNVLHEHSLNLLGQASIARARLTDHLVQQPVRIQEITCSLLKLTLQPVCFPQATEIEIDQFSLRAGVLL